MEMRKVGCASDVQLVCQVLERGKGCSRVPPAMCRRGGLLTLKRRAAWCGAPLGRSCLRGMPTSRPPRWVLRSQAHREAAGRPTRAVLPVDRVSHGWAGWWGAGGAVGGGVDASGWGGAWLCVWGGKAEEECRLSWAEMCVLEALLVEWRTHLALRTQEQSAPCSQPGMHALEGATKAVNRTVATTAGETTTTRTRSPHAPQTRWGARP